MNPYSADPIRGTEIDESKSKIFRLISILLNTLRKLDQEISTYVKSRKNINKNSIISKEKILNLKKYNRSIT
jgi:hypothetical protein